MAPEDICVRLYRPVQSRARPHLTHFPLPLTQTKSHKIGLFCQEVSVGNGLTEVDHTNPPPGLHIDVQGAGW